MQQLTVCDFFENICNYSIKIQTFGHSYDFHATMLQLLMISSYALDGFKSIFIRE
jgi:hypothetical protein